jgi:uncharacterized OB-fold protein
MVGGGHARPPGPPGQDSVPDPRRGQIAANGIIRDNFERLAVRGSNSLSVDWDDRRIAMLACLHCGREVSPRAEACPQCGEPGPAATPASYPASPVTSAMATVNRTDPFAIASIICAVVNFIGAFFAGAILAIIFGRIAEKNIAADPALGGANLARAGIIVGWVGLAIVAVFALLGFTFLGLFSGVFSDLPVRFTD